MEETSNYRLQNGRYTAQKWGKFIDEAEERKNNASRKAYRDEFLDIMRAYEKEHAASLGWSLECYNTAISSDFFKKHYALLSEKKLKTVLSRCKVMVLTANPIEKAVFHYCIVNKTSVMTH